jgi:GT2 family glycosyltransferase
MTNRPKLTISLLTWNGAHYLPLLLKSLTEQTFQDWELLVLDNASDDESIATIKEHYPPAKVIQQKMNLGFAKGHNLIINWSKSDYILFLNQDLMLAPNYLEDAMAFLEKNPNVASVSGKLLYWDFEQSNTTKIIDSFGLKMHRNRKVIDWQQGKKDYDPAVKLDQDAVEVFGLSATALLVRRAALEVVKLPKNNNQFEYFDEDFFSYKEDIDLAWRFRLAGYENWLVTSTVAYHHRSVSKLKATRADRQSRGIANKLSYRNHLATLYKNSFASNIWRDLFYILWYEFKKIIYFIIFERKTLKGFKEFLKLKNKLKKKRKYIKKNRKTNPEDIRNWWK